VKATAALLSAALVVGCGASRKPEVAPTPTVESRNAACRASRECRESGRCFSYRDFCVANDEKDCRASEACHTDGQCTLGPTDADLLPGACTAAGRDCRDALVCHRDGACIARRGRCVTPAACAETEDCPDAGHAP
jgi:hypothetical protein